MAPSGSLWERQIGQDIDNVKHTLSSWDNCMAESYCKYPVIVAIIIASLIVLSIVFCIARCCCCGLECCCGICSCCNACCPSPRNRRDGPSKFADQPGPYNNTGYQSHPPPVYNAPGYNAPAQYAQFDSGRKGAAGGGLHADALPAMPSWDTAASHRVPDDSHEESHELNQMTPHDEQEAPMLAHQAPPPSTHGDAFMAGAAAPSPYRDHSGYSQNAYSDPYAQQDEHDPLSRYGGPPSAAAASYGHSPTPSGFANQHGYQRGPSPYAQNAYEAPANVQPYGQATYGVTEATPQRFASPAHSPPAEQAYQPPASPPQHSASPVNAPASALPSALQTRTNTGPTPAYQAYGAAYTPTAARPQYTAYTPGGNNV